MRNDIKKVVEAIAEKHMTKGGISISSDHNGGKLRLAIDYIGGKKNETDAATTEIKAKYPNAVVYTFDIDD